MLAIYIREKLKKLFLIGKVFLEILTIFKIIDNEGKKSKNR